MAVTDTRAERTVLERYGAHAADPPVRGRDPPAVPARRGARHDPPLRRPGSRRRRRLRRPRADGDWVAGTYRGHGHALAAGTDPERLVAEMLGRATGICGGRAGSMNVVDLEHGLVGCFGIVGGSIGAATGAALSAKRTGNVAVAFFGDGATNQAYFHECLNFAAGGVAAGRVHMREQLLRRVHADAEGHRRRRHRRPGGRLRDGVRARRRQRPVGGDRDRGRGGRPCTLAAAARRWSRRRPTATTATRSPTRRRTGPRRRSSAGWSATRCSSPRARLLELGHRRGRDRGGRARGPRDARPRRRGGAGGAVSRTRRGPTAPRSSRHERARVPRRAPRRASPRRWSATRA